jgi:hypothetical protein
MGRHAETLARNVLLYDRLYSGCQKNVPVLKYFFLQPHNRLCRPSVFRNIIMESGIIPDIKSDHRYDDTQTMLYCSFNWNIISLEFALIRR